MAVIQRTEFALALNQVANERGVDVSVVLDTVQNAILAAYRKDHPGVEVEEYQAELNPNTGEAHIIHNGEDVTPPGFGRIAAQTAKQVILQKIREKEKEAIISDYKTKVGQIVNGLVLRFAGPNIIVEIGKTESIMPQSEQIVQEKYRLNQRMAVYIVDIKDGIKGEEIIVSRSHNGLMEGLFKREVPEISSGSVLIKDVVREPGNRSKVAVASNQSGIDPVGSCVGQKGVRIQAIIQEFGGLEKIDIIQWNEDIKTYVANSLSPAKNVTVELNEEEKSAQVYVPEDQLSLTIGGGGQNVRLASKLTGYRIEVESSGEISDEAKAESFLRPKATDEKKSKDKSEETKDTTETNNEENKKDVDESNKEVPESQDDKVKSTEEDVVDKNLDNKDQDLEVESSESSDDKITETEVKSEEPEVEEKKS